MLPSCLRPHVSHRVIVIGAIGRQTTATTSSASQGEAQATAGIANHLEKFWGPSHAAAIFAHLEAGGAGLEPRVRQAVERLKDKGSSR
jgi:formate dehydrogenase subunit delta